MNKYRRWTKEEDDLLRKLYKKKKLSELSIIFNRHWNKVCRRALRLGLKKDVKTYSKEISKTNKMLFKKGVRTHKKEKNPNWKGGYKQLLYGGIKKSTYINLHHWLKKKYGKANKCENKNCSGLSKKFNWAKKNELNYERKRENFMMLCCKCHKSYDRKETNGNISL